MSFNATKIPVENLFTKYFVEGLSIKFGMNKIEGFHYTRSILEVKFL